MVEQSTTRTTVSVAVALLMVVGFSIAPAVAVADDDVSAGDDTVNVDTGGLDDSIDADTDGSSSSTEGVQVNIVDTNSPVQTGETLVVTVDVESNEGGTAELLIDGETVDSKGFAPGQDGRENFTWDTSYQDAGNHTATVQSGVDNDSETVEVEPGFNVPEGACRNVPKEANENVPYEELPSRDELPEDAPEPPIPPFITPRGVANLVVGAVPNQCDIQDPNDPSVDPNDPPSDPDVTVAVIRGGQYEDGAVFRVYYEATLDDSGGGPGVYGTLGGIAYSGGVGTNPDVNVQDGQQEYVVDPMVRGDQSTADGGTEVGAPFGSVGATLECSGGECQPGTSGIPTFTEYPAVPAPIWDGEE